MSRLFSVVIKDGVVERNGVRFFPYNREKQTLHTPRNIERLDKYYSSRQVNRVYGGHLNDCEFKAMYLMQADWSEHHREAFYNPYWTEQRSPMQLESDVILLKKKVSGPQLTKKRGLNSWGLVEWNIFMTEDYFTVAVERLI